MPTLILLRHGQSEWNEQNLFTGWYDCDLTARGIDEAIQAGELLLQSDSTPDVIHSSLQKRAIKTAQLVNRSTSKKIPIYKNWRLNERHYGALPGLNKSEAKIKFGEQKIQEWRRGYNTPPPPISPGNRFNPKNNEAYKDLPEELIPLSECLADVMNRLLPYWFSDIVPDLKSGKKVLILLYEYDGSGGTRNLGFGSSMQKWVFRQVVQGFSLNFRQTFGIFDDFFFKVERNESAAKL